MIGTILNCAGILIGAILGKVLKTAPRQATEAYIRVVLAAFIVFFGLRLTWISINGTITSILLQLLMVVLALSLGKVIGRFLRLQKTSNQLGQFARQRMAGGSSSANQRFNDGFLTCTALFCAAPLGIIGAVSDGLTDYYYPLAAKGVLEGFAAFGFVRFFGWGVAMSALPVLAFQGTITLLCRQLEPVLTAHGLVEPVNAVGGLLIFSVALVMLDIKKLHLADYLPSLCVAPILSWLLKLH